jgi:cyclopropane-fatty-acyl-phospholipid synthase
MNNLLRHLAIVPETVLFGPSYGVVNYLIRSPQPLDPEWTWNYVTRQYSPLEDWIRMNYPPRWMRGPLLNWFLRPSHEAGIQKHYDVSNDFYELFLDKKYMLYSCADYLTGRETLEEAQTNKVNHIMNLVDPQPGEKILELGCGWGGMLQEVYNRTGDRENLHGYTIAQEQVEYNRQHRGFQVEFKNFITDEHPVEKYDKIYSIGAWEHVRPWDLQPTLEKLYRSLKPGGKMFIHFFCGTSVGVPVAGLVGQIFFPGSATPAYPTQLKTFKQTGFRVMHQSLHDTYKETLRHWFERLVENRDKAIELVGIRNFNKYVLFFPCSWKYFDDVQAVLWRVVLQKPPIGQPQVELADTATYRAESMLPAA